MSERWIGAQKLNALGLGCMGMSEFYGTPNDLNSIEVLNYAYDLGIHHFDTSDIYGNGHNEELLSNLIVGKRSNIFLSTKFGIIRENNKRRISNSDQHISVSLHNSLRRLKSDYIDLYYVHRIDRSRPIEETILTLSNFVKEGKLNTLVFAKQVLRRLVVQIPYIR